MSGKRKTEEPLKPTYRCRCCSWYSERKNLCPTCAAGCVMRRGLKDADPN